MAAEQQLFCYGPN